jgi:phosphatidylglycerol---prolipoprotein diacylglyceryl transferase
VYPVIAQVGGVRLATHPLFVALGVLAAVVVVVHESRRRGLWGDGMLVAIAGGLVGGGLGMRATSFLRSPEVTLHSPVLDVWQYGAKSILGGLAGAYLGVVVAKRLVGYRIRTGDVFAPAVALGMAIGRVGCLLTEPPGRPTGLPWGIRLTSEQVATIPGCSVCVPGRPLHPSFAYEIAFQLAAFLVLLWLRGRVTTAGALLTGYLAAYAAFRFGVEFTRDNEVVLAGLTRGQVFLLALAPVLAWRVARIVRLERSAHPAPDPDGEAALLAVLAPGPGPG